MRTTGIRFRSGSIAGVLLLLAVACGGESEGPGTEPEATGGDGGAPTGTNADAGASDGSGGTEEGSAGDSGDPGAAGAGGSSGSTGAGGGVSMGGGQAAGGGISRPPPMGGSGGTGGTPGPVEGCEPVIQSSGTDFCQIEFTCENSEYLLTYCKGDGAGSLSCSCQGANRYQDYQVEGISGLAACDLVADVCMEGKAVSFEEEGECGVQRTTGTSYCELSETCQRKADLGDGISAVLREYKNTSCYSQTSSTAYCQCSDGATWREYRLETGDLTNSCDALHDLCTSGEEPTYTGELECKFERQSSGTGYCEVSEVCSRVAEIGDDLIAVHEEDRYASCSAGSGEQARCSCSSAQGSLRFDRAGSPIPDTCLAALEPCKALDKLEVEDGSVTCRPTSQFADTGFCNASLDCALDATFDGEPLRVYGNVQVFCSPTDDAWSCSCSSNTSSGTLTIELDDPWEACTEAAERCPEVVDVQPLSGGSGVGGMGPIPPPGRPIPF